MTEAIPADTPALLERIRNLEAQVFEAEETLAAMRRGDIDAVVVSRSVEDFQVYTLLSEDQPYRVFIEQIQEGATTLTEQGTILYCNRRLATMIGLQHEHVIGQKLQHFMPPESAAAFARMIGEAKNTGVRGELTFRPASAAEVPVNISLSFLRHDDGESVFCAVVTDLSNHKRHITEIASANTRLLQEISGRALVEEKLYHSQKLEAIGRLSAGVAHDFNNVLQSVVSSLEAVLDEVADGTAAQEFVNVALDATKRGASLTSHLLSYARKQTLTPQVTELAPLLVSLQKLLRPTLQPNIAVEVRVAGSPLVVADPGMLQTALLNLAINAAHAMPSGGTLKIDANAAPDGAPWLVVAVTDSGVGMDEATLAQATEPFYTTKGQHGTGLGLSMVQGFVEQSGGTIRIDSVPGRGTSVELRLSMAAVAPAHEHMSAASAPLNHGRILLVDDSKDVLIAAGAFLEKAGFAVVRADRGDKALALLSEEGPFDALVSDYAMPGLNGADLVVEGRVIQPGLPAVLITGFVDVDRSDLVSEGTLILRKPFARVALMDALKTVLEPHIRKLPQWSQVETRD